MYKTAHLLNIQSPMSKLTTVSYTMNSPHPSIHSNSWNSFDTCFYYIWQSHQRPNMPLSPSSEIHIPFPFLSFSTHSCCFISMYIDFMKWFPQQDHKFLGNGFPFILYIPPWPVVFQHLNDSYNNSTNSLPSSCPLIFYNSAIYAPNRPCTKVSTTLPMHTSSTSTQNTCPMRNL